MSHSDKPSFPRIHHRVVMFIIGFLCAVIGRVKDSTGSMAFGMVSLYVGGALLAVSFIDTAPLLRLVGLS